MAVKKVGALIKDARTNAGLSQEKLAGLISGLSAADISKAERGEKDLTQEQLKAIAKATGVTQKSLLEAAGYVKTTSGKTASEKTSSGKTTAGKTSAAEDNSLQLSATEKKLVQLYREADSAAKKRVMSILKGEEPEGGDLISTIIGSALGQIMK